MGSEMCIRDRLIYAFQPKGKKEEVYDSDKDEPQEFLEKKTQSG